MCISSLEKVFLIKIQYARARATVTRIPSSARRLEPQSRDIEGLHWISSLIITEIFTGREYGVDYIGHRLFPI